MIFPTKKSALVRLSDCIKCGIGNCLDTTKDIIDLYAQYEVPFETMKSIARDIRDGKLSVEEGEKRIAEANAKIPMEVAVRGVSTQGRLHSECLSVVLTCCFALESYINSLGYHLLQENDFLGLIRSGHDMTAELLFSAIEKMSTPSKWETIGKIKKGKGFDRAKSPYQDLKIVFNFRNDIVHDKVADYSDERVEKRYNKKLPDPVFGQLNLSHAVFAADTYWAMISQIHAILETDMDEFHKHYNLQPWFNGAFEAEAREASQSYLKVMGQEG